MHLNGLRFYVEDPALEATVIRDGNRKLEVKAYYLPKSMHLLSLEPAEP